MKGLPQQKPSTIMGIHLPKTHVSPSYIAREIITFIKRVGGETNETTITVLIITAFLADFNHDTWGTFNLISMILSLEETSEAMRMQESENPSIPSRSFTFSGHNIRTGIQDIVEDGHLEPVASNVPEEELYRTTDNFPAWCLSELARLSGYSFTEYSQRPLS